MHDFYGAEKRRSYFEGWYLKHQCGPHTVAFIPSYHVDRKGDRSASLQVITQDEAFHLSFPAAAFSAEEKGFLVRVENCEFTEEGCRLDLAREGLTLSGALRYGAFAPPERDMMGPFRLLPMMQCRHRVWSFSHRVDGTLTINGKECVFDGGVGYLEGDRGESFPKKYLWTQCNFGMDCIMISVADIPLLGGRFTGCIASLFLNGKEYRLATYSGARVLHVGAHSAVLRQDDLVLTAQLLEDRGQALRAPQNGRMDRMIRESAACKVRYRLMKGNKVLFDKISEQAGFEAEWRETDEPAAT